MLTRYPGVIFTIVIAVSCWGLYFLGVMAMPSGLLYDTATKHSLDLKSPQSQTLLVEAEIRKRWAGDDYWLPLLDALQQQDARQVIFTFIPAEVSNDFFAVAKRYGNVIYGRSVVYDDIDPQARAFTALPASAPEDGLRYGVVAEPPASFGVYRHQRHTISVDGVGYPSLEVVSARQAGIELEDMSAPPYLVNFIGGLNRIPVVSARRVLDKGLIPELVQGKSVLIGFANDGMSSGFHTPITQQRETISLLSYQGYALNTLLSGNIPSTLSPATTFATLLITSAFGVFFFQWLTLGAALRLTLTLSILFCASAWLFLSLFHVWIPLAEALLALLATFLLVFRHKAISEERSLREMVFSSAAQIHDRIVPPSFFASSEHWSKVVNLVNQTLDLNRIIFLERKEGEARLQEIKTLNCSFDDILERRRDYQRSPYSTAIAENAVIPLRKQFFRETSEREDQYMAPLQFAGEVLGFWAFSVNPDKAASIPMFTSRVNDYANQIAELLYHRQRWLAHHQPPRGAIGKYLTLETDRRLYRTLRRSTELVNRRLKSLEDVFDGLGTATTLYDLFGGIVQINRSMADLLQGADLRPFELTPLELITAVTDMDVAQARHTLRYVVLERGSVTVPMALNGATENVFVLNIRPLKYVSAENASDVGPAPFQLLGMLFEIVDITNFRKLYDMREHLVERLNIQLRNDMESILLATGLLKTPNLTERKRSRVLNIVQEKVGQAIDVIQEAQHHLDVDVDSALTERYPVDGKQLIESALVTFGEQLAARNIQLQPELDPLVGLVFAEPAALSELISNVVNILIEDATENSHLVIGLGQISHGTTYQHTISFTFRNSGFGMPNQRLQAFLFGDGEVSSESFTTLRNLVPMIESWGGTLKAHGEVGVGLSFTLQLRGFL